MQPSFEELIMYGVLFWCTFVAEIRTLGMVGAGDLVAVAALGWLCGYFFSICWQNVQSRPKTINLYDGLICHDAVVVVAVASDYSLATGTLRLADYLQRARSDWQLIIGDPSAN